MGVVRRQYYHPHIILKSITSRWFVCVGIIRGRRICAVKSNENYYSVLQLWWVKQNTDPSFGTWTDEGCCGHTQCLGPWQQELAKIWSRTKRNDKKYLGLGGLTGPLSFLLSFTHILFFLTIGEASVIRNGIVQCVGIYDLNTAIRESRIGVVSVFCGKNWREKQLVIAVRLFSKRHLYHSLETELEI